MTSLSRASFALLRALTLALLAAGCQASTSTATDPVAAQPAAPESGRVRVAEASRKYVEAVPIATLADKAAPVVRAPGRAAFRDGAVARVAAPAEGRIAEIHVKVGDRVKAGDPLVTLKSPTAAAARAELEAAALARKATRAALERQTAMAAKGVGVEAERFQAEVELAKAEAELARAQRTAGYLGKGGGSAIVITAPIDGTVLHRDATPGATVEPGGGPLIEIGDPGALWVVLDVFERDIALVQPGAKVRVELSTLPAPLSGKVASVGAALAAGSRAAPVYVTLDEPPAGVRAGMFARGTIEAGPGDGVSVPVASVLVKDGRTHVVYVERGDDTFERREVTIGPVVDGHVRVLGGLAADDRVVVKGALLVDGAADQLL